MTIELHVDLQTLTWAQFLNQTPYSIALDGYVRGGPRFTYDRDGVLKGPYLNLNHHEEVDRLATRSTCAQVLMSLRQGLFQAFRDQHGPRAHVWVNDCDEDVCTAWTLLNNHCLAEGAVNPLVNRLVAMEDALDCTAGAYPFPQDLPVLREMAWVFEPYRQFRLNGGLDKRDPAAFRAIIQDVELRILQHVTGKGKEVPLDTRYELLGGNSRCSLVQEIGAQARTGMFSHGIRAFVSVRERPDGSNAYVIGKMSPFIPLDLLTLADDLNEEEHCPSEDLWGGGDTIIGSPRKAGSKLSTDEILAHVSECAW